jgi:hypothetical protein
MRGRERREDPAALMGKMQIRLYPFPLYLRLVPGRALAYKVRDATPLPIVAPLHPFRLLGAFLVDPATKQIAEIRPLGEQSNHFLSWSCHTRKVLGMNRNYT